jgi:protein translocase SecG subunit
VDVFLNLLLTSLLLLTGFCVIIFILMQRPSDGGGFGNSIGGSALESAFGGDAGNVLMRATVRLVALFFLLSLLLSLHQMRQFHKSVYCLEGCIEDHILEEDKVPMAGQEISI